MLLAASAPPGALAQLQLRARSTTTAQLIQLRPLRYDTVSASYLAGDAAAATPLQQDIELTAWGFGVRGLRFASMIRLRSSLGSSLVWPRSDDHFDAYWAFVELERESWRLRAGRIQHPSPIIMTTFDGAAAMWRPHGRLRAEVFGGRSLVRALAEPATTSAIASLDPFVTSQGQLVAGVSAWAEPVAAVSAGFAYQREVTSDFGALVGEYAALQGGWSNGRVALSGSAVYDLGHDTWGRSRLSGVLSAGSGASAELALFQRRPLFPLNTIWGVFAPQGHWGASVTGEAPLLPRVRVSAGYTMRRYQPTTETTPFLPQLDDVTHTVRIAASLRQGPWQARGAWLLNLGYGGEHSGFEALGGYRRERWDVSGELVAFQESEELRVGSGTVYGIGASGRVAIGAASGLRGSLMQYFHRDTGGASAPNWSQLRALIALELTFGANADGGAP